MAAKRAISITLDSENITWLKGRAGVTGVRSVSELVDQLVTAARRGGRVGPSRSVVGTVDIDPSDSGLEHADEAVRATYDRSLSRPLIARERGATYPAGTRGAGKRRG